MRNGIQVNQEVTTVARRGTSGTGMAYDYALNVAKFAEQQRANRAREEQRRQSDSARLAIDSYRNSLLEQGARLKAANEAFNTAYKLHQDQKAERALNHAALFMQGYNLIPENAPNRREQVNWLMGQLPEAMKVPEIQKMISADNARLEPKAGLTKDEHTELAGLEKNQKTLFKQAQNEADPNHVTAAIQYGRMWDLRKKSLGMQSGTEPGTSINDYVKNITASVQPNAAPAAPPPSTPAPQNVEAWSNATVPDIAMPQVPQQPAAAPAATTPAPARQGVRDFLGLPKTSDAGAASSAASDRDELNNMMNASPETQFAAPQPQATPTPTPEPGKNKEAFYTA